MIGKLTYRAVYDDDELGKFVELLDSTIKSHDREIERMCNYHYQGFIDSVRELLQVSTDAAHLRVIISSSVSLHSLSDSFVF